MRIILLILSCLIMTQNAYAKGIQAEHFRLNNGMQVVVSTNTKAPAVSHMVWYKAGGQDEPHGKSGIAHFLEHLMFKGTKTVGKGEFSKIVAKAGGNDNAFTSSDYTAYFQNISRGELEMVMKLESDRMSNLIFDESEVLKERKVILEERSARIDNDPSAKLREQMKSVLYLNHPYSRPLIGWRHEMEGLSLADAKRWYNNYYAPNNTVLIVSGDITIAELKPLAEKYYGKVKPKTVPVRHELREPEHIAQRRLTLYDNKVARPEWMRYYMAPSQNSALKEHCYALIVLSHILGASDTSRLYQKLVVEDELASSIGSFYEDLMLGPSIFAIYAIPANGHNLSDIESAIDKEIVEIKDDGVSRSELNRAKHSLIAKTIYAQEDLKSLAYIYGQAITTNAGVDYVKNWEENIDNVSKSDIKAAARAVFKAKSSVTGELMRGEK